MTKGELIESIVIQLNGGRLTSDSKIRREDVNVLLAAAINYATIAQYRANKDETGDNEFPQDFVSTYPNVEVQVDDDRELSYIDLPTGILSLPKNYGLQSVSAMKGNNLFVQINFMDRQNVSYYANSYADTTLYWLEGERVYFQNIATDKVLVRLIQSIKELEDDDVLPISAGLEIDVLKIMSEWFSGQKQMPADMKPDNNNNLN